MPEIARSSGFQPILDKSRTNGWLAPEWAGWLNTAGLKQPAERIIYIWLCSQFWMPTFCITSNWVSSQSICSSVSSRMCSNSSLDT